MLRAGVVVMALHGEGRDVKDLVVRLRIIRDIEFIT